jgi:hypothetical protein
VNVDRVRLIKDLVGCLHCNRVADVEHVCFAEICGAMLLSILFWVRRDFFKQN